MVRRSQGKSECGGYFEDGTRRKECSQAVSRLQKKGVNGDRLHPIHTWTNTGRSVGQDTG